MNGMKPCQPGCAWNVAGQCAMSLIAQQAERGSNELYAMTELLGGAEMECFDNGAPEKVAAERE